VEEVQQLAARIIANVEQVIVGKRRIVELVLVLDHTDYLG